MPVSGSIPRNSEPLWVSDFQKPGIHFKIHFYPFLNTKECSHNLLLSFNRKLRVVSGFLGTGNPYETPSFGFLGTEPETDASTFLLAHAVKWLCFLDPLIPRCLEKEGAIFFFKIQFEIKKTIDSMNSRTSHYGTYDTDILNLMFPKTSIFRMYISLIDIKAIFVF